MNSFNIWHLCAIIAASIVINIPVMIGLGALGLHPVATNAIVFAVAFTIGTVGAKISRKIQSGR